MAKLEVVPYKPWHATEILRYGMNDDKVSVDAKAYEERLDFSQPGMSFSLLADDKLVCAGGVYPLWTGVAEGWVLSSRRIFDFSLSACKAIKERTDYICTNNKIWRLQTAVRADFEVGVRFAKWLGLKKEGLMMKYGPDGSNYYKMAKIYEYNR
jgi:hypothetical protein